MKIIHCPLNGPRNASEFICAGPVRPSPDTVQENDDRLWGEYLFFENNPAGVMREWWRHTPSNYWFIVERDTRTDEIISTYAPEDVRS
jgi:sarcosine oxidase, subunit delta